MGRTENSIKNYYYSSIRRIKSNELSKLIKDLHVEGKISYDELK